jgi:ABC-type Zn2+ transport system substrate-binding protein/surface adhesin
MFESIKENEKARVGQRKIVPVMVDIRKLKTAEVHVLYITPGTKTHLKKIVEHSREKKVLTISGVAEHLEQGVSIGILPKGDAYQIVLNLTGAEQEEAEFDAALHKLAKTMRSPR